MLDDCLYPIWPGQARIEEGHHPQCKPKPFLEVAVEEANIRIQQDVYQDKKVLYLSHKKVGCIRLTDKKICHNFL